MSLDSTNGLRSFDSISDYQVSSEENVDNNSIHTHMLKNLTIFSDEKRGIDFALAKENSVKSKERTFIGRNQHTNAREGDCFNTMRSRCFVPKYLENDNNEQDPFPLNLKNQSKILERPSAQLELNDLESSTTTTDIRLDDEHLSGSYSMQPIFSKVGIKLSFLCSEFIGNYGRLLKGKSTGQVCNEVIKRVTFNERISFCEWLSKIKRPFVGDSTVFISHAWTSNFLEMIDALKYHFLNSSSPHYDKDVIVWLDIFSHNQHQNDRTSLATFKTVIQEIGHTVMVLSSWHNPIPLSRTWCLFELYCTKENFGRFEVALSPLQRDKFLESAIDDPESAANRLQQLIIDIERSECTDFADKERIFEVVRQIALFADFPGWNKEVIDHMNAWLINIFESQIEIVDPLTKFKIHYTYGMFLFEQGKYLRAAELLESCVLQQSGHLLELRQINCQILSEVMNNWGQAYRFLGRLQEALAIQEQVLMLRKAALGEDHPATLKSLHNIAQVFQESDHDKAEKWYTSCLLEKRRVLGNRDPDTIAAIRDLASFLNCQRKYDEAELLFNEVLKAEQDGLGVEDPSTAMNLAILHGNQGKFDQAELALVDCLQRYRDTSGDGHPHTSTAKNNLADVLEKQGKYEEAETFYREALDGFRKELGDRHQYVERVIKSLQRLRSMQQNNVKNR